MSSLNAITLHGQGTKPRNRYHFARPRMAFEDNQQPKNEDGSTQKREERSGKTQSSSTGLIVILVIMVGLTWGIAATAYFGVVDYKALITGGSQLTAADAADFILAMYPFQYECFRHPLKAIASLLTVIDDSITYLFTFSRAPYEIIDKRRIVAGIGPSRKTIMNLAKRETPSAELIPPPDGAPEQDNVESIKKVPGDEEKKSERKQEPEKTKQPEEENERKSEKVVNEQAAEKSKDPTMTISLQLFVGDHRTVTEKHFISADGFSFHFNALKEPKLQSFRDTKKEDARSVCFMHQNIIDKCNLFDNRTDNERKVLFIPFPLNKPENGHEKELIPPQQKFVSNSVTINKQQYPEINEKITYGNLPSLSSKRIIPYLPMSYQKPRKLGENCSKNQVKYMPAPQIALNKNGYFEISEKPKNIECRKKITISTNPVTYYISRNDLVVSEPENESNFGRKCLKTCTLEVKFGNKKPNDDQNLDKTFVEKDKLVLVNNALNKIQYLEHELNQEYKKAEIIWQKLVLPNPVNKHLSVGDEGEELTPYLGVHKTVPGSIPVNKRSVEKKVLSVEEFEKYPYKVTVANFPAPYKLAGGGMVAQKMGVREPLPTSSYKLVVSLLPCNKIKTRFFSSKSMTFRVTSNPTVGKIRFVPHKKQIAKASGCAVTAQRIIMYVKELERYKRQILLTRTAVPNVIPTSNRVSFYCHTREECLKRMNRDKKTRKITTRGEIHPLTRQAKLKRYLRRFFSLVSEIYNDLLEVTETEIIPSIAQFYDRNSKLFKNSTFYLKMSSHLANTTVENAYLVSREAALKCGVYFSDKYEVLRDFLSSKKYGDRIVRRAERFRLKMEKKFNKLNDVLKSNVYDVAGGQRIITVSVILLFIFVLYNFFICLFHAFMLPRP